jgi:spermidine synthase
LSQDESNHSSFRNKLILIIFGLSGMSALIYEVIWIRPLSLVFGTTTFAVSIIIAGFLSGLALGSWIAGRFSDKVENPLKIYGFIEICIGLYGLMLISLFSALPGIYLGLYQSTFPNIEVFYILQFILAFVIILIPTTLMGATLPTIMKSYSRKFSDVGKDLGRIYSVNNIGAVLGTLAAGFVMMPLLGIQTSIMITAVLNIGVGIIALVASKSKHTKKILGIVIIVVIASSFSVYDFKLMQFGIPYYTSTQLTMEFVNDFVESQGVLFHKESMYSSVSVVSFDDGSKIMKISGKNQCSNSPKCT